MLITKKYFRYDYGDDGEMIPINVSKIVSTRQCCEGYTLFEKRCRRDLCLNLHCSDDPGSNCTMVKRCGEIFPIFVTQQRSLSVICTQPEEAKAHLCPNDVCSAGSTCTSQAAVCLGSRCGCSAGPVWHLKEDLMEADC